jgi:hypothetical protein
MNFRRRLKNRAAGLGSGFWSRCREVSMNRLT